jgi:hypothetical protein
MAVQIQLRNDVAANWTSVNPTLAQGEIGLEIDTNKMKIGTGTDVWEDLPYTGVDSAELVPLVSFTHTQGVDSSTWTINHNLGFYPSVTVFLNSGDIVEGTITHSNVNSLTISFSAAIQGSAYLS